MPRRRTLYAWYRFVLFLLYEFRWATVVFWSLVLLGGWALQGHLGGTPMSFVRACHTVFCMIFFSMPADFPDEWYLQLLFFVVPVIGLGAVADSVVRLGYYVFTSKCKLPEWHRMNALSMRDHIVLCGVGKVGYRILEELLALKVDVVAIDQNSAEELVQEMIDRGVTILIGNARSRHVLQEANVAKARAVIVATDDDLANIDAALTAREINPGIRVVIRLFDDTLAQKVATAFRLPAISTAANAASAFVAAATDREIFQSFQMAGQKFNVAGLKLKPSSRLVGRPVVDVEREFEVKIVLACANGSCASQPAPEALLAEAMQLVVVAPVDAVAKLESANA